MKAPSRSGGGGELDDHKLTVRRKTPHVTVMVLRITFHSKRRTGPYCMWHGMEGSRFHDAPSTACSQEDLDGFEIPMIMRSL